MNKNDYNNLVSNLSNATRVADAPPPVLDDQINFLKETGKVTLETLGGGLAGKSVEGSIKLLRKVAPEISEAAEGSSDVASLATNIIGGGARAAARLVGNQIGSKVPLPEAGEVATQGTTTAGLESMQSVTNSGLGSTVEDALPQLSLTKNATGASEIFNDASSSAEEAVGKAAKIAGDVDKAAKIEGDITKATTGSLESDAFDPEGLVVTGALGLAGVIAGLFVKTHRTVNVTPTFNPTMINYGAQAGVE